MPESPKASRCVQQHSKCDSCDRGSTWCYRGRVQTKRADGLGVQSRCFRQLLMIALMTVLCWPAVGWAQSTTASVFGVAKDTSGAVIPGVTIRLQNVGTGASRTVTTDAEGRYVATDLPIGAYELRATLAGFKEFVRTGITLVVGQQAVINVALEVGNVNEQVNVTAEAPLIETATSQMAGLVSSTQVRELPLNGRSFDQLALLQPGVQPFRQVTTTPSTSFGTRMSVSGARLDANNVILDGIEINDWSRSGGGSAAGLFLGVDAVQEFKVLTHNYSAEYGRNSGAEITVVTRSGTNQYHGSLFEFIRNDAIDARNFFDKQKSILRRNQFGGFVSGPIVRDRFFFAANYEGFRERRASPFTNFVLTADARRGLLPSGTINVPSSVIPYLSPSVMPLPNAGTLPGGVTGRYIFQFHKPTNEDFGMGRLDYRFGDKDSIFVRYTRDISSSLDPDSKGATPFFGAIEDFKQQNGLVQYTRVLNPNLLNVFRAGVKRAVPKSLPFTDAAFPQQQLTFIPGQPFGFIAFSTSANTFGSGASTTLSNFGQAGLTPGHWLDTGYQVNDQVAYTLGPHSLKLGAEYELIRDGIDNGTVLGGQFTFTSIEGFLSATPVSFTAPLPSRDVSNDFVQHAFAWYLIDDYRLKPRLILNLGLRHELVTAPYDRRPARTASLVDIAHDSDASLTPEFFQLPLNNLAPRIGFAWDVTGDGKTSIRSAFGMFYNLWLGRDYGVFVQPAPLYRGTLTIQAPLRQPQFPNEYLIQQGLGFPTASSRPTGSNMQYRGIKTPTALQYSLEVERQLFAAGTLKVAYVGSKGYNLLSNENGNPRIPTFLSDGRIFFPASAPLVNPSLNTFQQRSSQGDSRYNSVQMEFRMRPVHGLELQTNYVFSRSIDDISSEAGADTRGAPALFENPFNHSMDKALSDFDVRHLFTLNSLYELPSPSNQSRVLRNVLGGWSIGDILSVSSGNPFTALTGFCQSNVTVNCGADRPNLLPNARPRIIGSPDQYFDTAAFGLQSPGFFGNAGRNILTGPGLLNLDLSIFKSVKFRENNVVQFRAEMFNVLNHANFGLPGLNLFTPTGGRQSNAGVIVATVTRNREIQFGLKLSF